ncbi:MAG TPA: metal-dependent hydrolase, partial [Acidobacteriaceae bacterium]
MEPVTHMLTGACLSRAGLNRKAAYATLTMVVAAEFPDVDMLWGLRGPVDQFQHHRGITHAFLGLPFEAAFIVAGVYGWHRWLVARRARAEAVAGSRSPLGASRGVRRPLTAAPVRWGVLYGFALLALLSHLLLDYTNSYGLRPFFPFNDRWYAASIVFIFDPVIFTLFLGALTAPWLFGLVGTEVGARKQPFRARGWAITALLGVVGWWALREVEHGRAVQLAMTQSIPTPGKKVVPRGPDPIDQ